MKRDSLKQYVTLRQSLTAEKDRLETRLKAINAALGETPKVSGAKLGRPRKRTMSAEARARISAAQTARWAKINAAKKKAKA